MKNNQNLFFSPEEKGRAFSDVLKEVQEYISSKYSTLMVEGGSEEVNSRSSGTLQSTSVTTVSR